MPDLSFRLNDVTTLCVPESSYVHVPHLLFDVIALKIGAFVCVDHSVISSLHFNTLTDLRSDLSILPQPFICSGDKGTERVER